MPELLAGTLYSNQSFRLAENCSGAGLAAPYSFPGKWTVPKGPLFVSNTADWVAKTLTRISDVSVATTPESNEMLISFERFVFGSNGGGDSTELAESVRSFSAQAQGPLDSRASRSAGQWITELRAWIASHPRLPYEADDSPESIYQGCGE